MRARMKLLHHAHSGLPRAHEHTSYAALFMLLALVGASLTLFTTTAFTATPGPETRSIGLTGTLPGNPPNTAAIIKVPTNGQRFNETPIEVSGTCPENTLVELFKNDIFAGSTICGTDGNFRMDIDLLIGRNVLIAKVYDTLNQAGPESDPVTVFFDVNPAAGEGLSPLSFGSQQLLLNTDSVFRGSFPGQTFTMPIDIIGGRAPYAVNIQWGDATNKVISRTTNETFRADHVYKKAGTYTLTVQATDADGRIAFLTVASIINGTPYGEAAGTLGPPSQTILQRLLVLWPLYAILLTMVVSFWLGEKREKRLLEKHGALLPA